MTERDKAQQAYGEMEKRDDEARLDLAYKASRAEPKWMVGGRRKFPTQNNPNTATGSRAFAIV